MPKATSYEQFFRACEELRNNAETVRSFSNLKQVGEWLEKRGTPVGATALGEAMKACGIVLEGKPNRVSKMHTSRVIAEATMVLYRKLGEEPSKTFSDLVERLKQGHVETPVVQPVPVAAVPNPATIPVANGRPPVPSKPPAPVLLRR